MRWFTTSLCPLQDSFNVLFLTVNVGLLFKIGDQNQ
jgi:predicted Kef-type K+ transport protein